MTIYELRELLKKTPIDELPLRCATYSRVSTEKETQAASLVNMTDDFRDYVERRPNWAFVKAYIDDGKSGLTTKKRKDFLQMLTAGASGGYDLLITGEISRFGRNTMEGLENIKYLKERGIPVLFLYDDLNTYDPECEIQIQQKLVDAENESHKISKRVKRGHAKSIQKGRVLGNRIWGYTKENCRLIPNEYAPMVQLIFELYATNRYSMKEIEDIIYARGWRNTRGNRLSHTTMANIIANPKYKGWYAGRKVVNDDLMAHHRTFLPEDEWVMFKDETGETVPALVSEEVWEAANEVLKRRSIDVKTRRNCSTHKNIYTGKIFCAVDGEPYYRKDANYKGQQQSKWVCSRKIKQGAKACPSIAIYEDELNPVVLSAFRAFMKSGDAILDLYLARYRKAVTESQQDEGRRQQLEQELAKIDAKQEALLDQRLEGVLTLDEYKRLLDKTRVRRSEVEEELSHMTHRADLTGRLEEQIETLRAALSARMEQPSLETIDRDFVDRFIERIEVNPLGDNRLEVSIQLLTGENLHHELSQFKGRTGQTFKKMIEAYENGLK